MNAPDQLTLFEPSGSELSLLALTHAEASRKFERQAVLLELRGFWSSRHALYRKSEEAQEQATVCEMAFQFEQLAGLS